MSFDGIFTRAMVQELKQVLLGGRVNKIDQPFDNECILTVRNQRVNYSLLLSAHPQYARLHLTQRSYQNPLQAPQFTMVMRKHLNRASLVDIQQVGNDRVVIFSFKNYNELGDKQDLQLILEVMGRHSNLILLDQDSNKILEAIRHLPPSVNSYRTILPGAEFRPAPSQDKLNPFDVSNEILLDRLKASTKDKLPQQLMDSFEGLGKDSAQEIAKQSGQLMIQVPATMKKWKEKFDKGLFQPSLYTREEKSYFTAFNYSIYAELDRQEFASLSQLLDEYYEDKANRDHVHQVAKDIEVLVKNEYDKNVKKRDKQLSELKETDRADDLRVQGEVLTAYNHKVEKGMTSIRLPNFYDQDKEIDIELDPLLSGPENAQRLFSNYQKLKNRKEHLSQAIQDTEAEIEYWDNIQTQIDLAQTEDIVDIKEELIEEGYIKAKGKQGRKKKNKKAKPHHYQTSSGLTILVGRNNRQNDELTLKKSDKNHYWFHCKNIPGSHVILQSPTPSDQDILEAASIAAYHSKAQASSNVPVDYVQVKHVRKPNGAKPGFVIYEQQKTIYVTPEKSKIQALKP